MAETSSQVASSSALTDSSGVSHPRGDEQSRPKVAKVTYGNRNKSLNEVPSASDVSLTPPPPSILHHRAFGRDIRRRPEREAGSPPAPDVDDDGDGGPAILEFAWRSDLKELDKDLLDEDESFPLDPAPPKVTTAAAVAYGQQRVPTASQATSATSMPDLGTSSPLSSHVDTSGTSLLPHHSPATPPSSPSLSAPPPARHTEKLSRRKKDNKGKGKANDEPVKPRVKRPTKKEIKEAKLETARILSDRRVSLEKPEDDRRLKLNEVLKRMQTTQKRVPVPEDSDPIRSFSSSSGYGDFAAASKTFTTGARKQAMSLKNMNRGLLSLSREQAKTIRHQKEEEWTGKLKRPISGPSRGEGSREQSPAPTESGLEQGEPLEHFPTSEEEVFLQDSGEDESDVEEPHPGTEFQAATEDEGAGGTDTEEEDPVRLQLYRRRPSRRKMVQDDDDSPVTYRKHSPAILVPGTSFVVQGAFPGLDAPHSLSSASESELDKENRAHRVFHRGDDKENTGAPRQIPRARHYEPDEDGGARALTGSPLSWAVGGGSDKENVNLPNRKPLAPLSREGSDIGLLPAVHVPVFGLRDAAEVPDRLGSPPIITPRRNQDDPPIFMLNRSGSRASAFGESIEEPDENREATGSPGFSQFFDKEEAPEVLGADALRRKIAERNFIGTHPEGMVISTADRRRDDEIQGADAVEETPVKGFLSSKSEWFVNDSGLMTQTRPSPSALRAFSQDLGPDEALFKSQRERSLNVRDITSPIPRRLQGGFSFLETAGPSQLDPSPLLRRSPSPEPSQLRRIRRGSPARIVDNRPGDAFQLMMKHASTRVKPKERRKLERSEFIEGEAAESDDEIAYGFGGSRTQDDDEEGEDDDGLVEGLVDDAQMEEDVLARDLVLEKHKEHEQADEAENLRLAEAAVAGKLRTKRRDRGLGFEDSESDEEDHGRPRHLGSKKRKIEDDALDDLANDPTTKPFFDSYHDGLGDDDLQIEVVEEDIVIAEDSEEDADDVVVSVSEVREQARRMARQQQDFRTHDPEDLDWLETEEDLDDDLQIKEVSSMPKHAPKRTGLDSMDRDFGKKHSTFADPTKLGAWAKEESQSRSFSVRPVGAVTGHKSFVPSAPSSSAQPVTRGNRGVERKTAGLGGYLAKKHEG